MLGCGRVRFIPPSLTTSVLGAVFDKVYFPGVHLPAGGFDQAELDASSMPRAANLLETQIFLAFSASYDIRKRCKGSAFSPAMLSPVAA
jgi:hypothetical protein